MDDSVVGIRRLKRDFLGIFFWFFIYLATAGAFGGIYYHAYLEDNSVFSINSNPYNQALITYHENCTILERTTTAINRILLQVGMPFSDLVEYPIQVDDLLSKDNRKIKLFKLKSQIPREAQLGPERLDALDELIKKHQHTSEQLLSSWHALSAYSAYKNNETYIDFLYFSLVTITSTGYGDIIPNQTMVRIYVGIELLIVVFLMVFGINYLIRK